jgi:hypothetical protein
MTDFHVSSRLPRVIAAAAATLCTVLTVASVIGLALHYEASAPAQMAAAVDSNRPA